MKKMFAIVLAFTTFSFSSYAYEGYASKGYLGDFGQETVLCQINAQENQVSIADAMNMASNSNSDCSELFFSGYNEPGSGSKFVVVYNPTGNSISLSGYKITKFVNGDDFNEGVDYALSGTIASYGVHQVGNGSSGTNIGGGASWNGDDAIALYNGTTMIDLIGEVGYDPGSSWSSGGVSTANKTLRRKSTVKKGVTTNPTTFNPSLEWEVVSLSDVDQHTSDCESSLPACATDTTFTFSDCDSTQFNGVYYTANTTITDTLTNAAGCDSLIYNQIIVHPSYAVSESENGVDSLIFNGTTYYADTTVVDTLASIFGCDSVISTSIEVYISPNPCTELFITEYLEGYSSNRAIEIYNPTASAISLANYSLRKYDGSNTTPNSTIYSSWSTASIPAYGTYTVAHNSAFNTTKNLADATTTNSVLSFSGNDAIGLFKGNALVDIVGSVGTTTNFAQNKTLVRKNNVQLGKLTYDASDWYSLSVNNIDSLGMHNSVCEPPSCDVDTTLTFSDCDSTQFNGVYYLTNTTILDTFPLGGGCDSIVINEIIVHPSYTITDSKSGSDSVIVHGTTYFTDTTAVDTLSSFLGCDSVVTTSVTVILPAPDCSEIFISEYAEKGNTKAIELYNPTSSAIDLNDYVLKKHNSGSQSNTNSLNLKGTINAHDVYLISYNQAPSAVQAVSDTVTSSSAMTFNGNDPVGIYKNNILVDIVGEIGNSSDHIEDVTLQRKSAIKIGSLTYSVGDWNSLGANFTDSLGNHTSECATAVSPCATVDTTLTVVSCESYIYGSTTFMNDTIYVDSLLSIAGCDSVVTLNLTINTGSSDTMNVSTCDATYSFGGMNITTAGMYADTNSNVNGCDSIEVLNIVFNTGSSDTMNISTCDASYSFGGMNITTAGMYADTNSNVNGCDSIEVLNIVFNTGSSDTMNISTCDASYSFGGMNITTSGMYADTNSNING
ncbi:MAG: lamin tail domain-containing protein, partial [Flavobacteriales bacterium]|nr:lamin tail domain-containing protein [Flavobacteriales bacterium]